MRSSLPPKASKQHPKTCCASCRPVQSASPLSLVESIVDCRQDGRLVGLPSQLVSGYVRIRDAFQGRVRQHTDHFEWETAETLLLVAWGWRQKELVDCGDKVQRGRIELQRHPLREDVKAVAVDDGLSRAAHPRRGLPSILHLARL